MAVRPLFCIPLLLSSLSAFAQIMPDLANPVRSPVDMSTNARTAPVTAPVIVSGKVVVDDGAVPTQPVAVQRMCNGQARTMAETDASGSFQVDLNRDEQPSSAPLPLPSEGTGPGQKLGTDCELKFELDGFASRSVPLTGITSGPSITNIGTVIIHRIARSSESIVSATAMAVPDKAKKEFEKGKQAESKGRWAAAKEKFKNALQRYPKFALAWLELGRLQVQQKEITAARESFQNAVSADSKLIDPYAELTNLAIEQKQWKDVVETTDHMLQVSDANSPKIWFYNAAGNFNLGHIDQAEKSLMRGMRLDSEHRVPQMEYLLGLVFARKRDYPAAAMHISEYLRLCPNAPDSAVARQQLDEFQKLAESAAGQASR
jgi:tetratricopeptide (TPR) repeat protein